MTTYTTIEDGLYARVGARVTSYFTKIDGQTIALGRQLDEARKKLAELRGTSERDDTIRAMCRGFIAEQRQMRLEGDSNALGQRTIEEYSGCLERHVIPVFGDMRAADFRPMHAAQYLAARRKGNPGAGVKGQPTSGNREMAALSGAFNYGMREGMVESNPCHGVKRNREKPRNREVGLVEFNAFMQFAKNQSTALYMAALIGATVAISGRRRAELLRLDADALTPEGIDTRDAKTKYYEADRNYLVLWSPLLRQILEEVKRIRPVESRYLFPVRGGRAPYTDQGFKCTWNKLMKAWMKAGGQHFTAHDLRAFYVSRMLDQDRDPNTHRNEATMRKVYDRRKTVEVSPLA
ncbi:hypothetical protein [uncultured Aquabacterium sp.]|uniref:site-specific integrase n=1 Tax=uncultured Aquabacterium sp. TaxID=158753 RepID=UPI0025E0BFFD|nr:hypothetical protein [uncultured Aquabacterium sp.]